MEGFENAIQRGRRYAEAGADMIFVEAPQMMEEVREIPRPLSVPLVINMFKGGKTPLVPMKQLEEWGYRIAIVPSSPQLAAIRAMGQLLKILKEEGTVEPYAEGMITFQEREEIVDLQKFQELEKRFLNL
ncbi:MAG: isocitrate lyase/phosphoenolpyruvate mutase family protein [Thermodesulfobacteriota bacterium]|nr:isocitrate lyase/phosphoenolpyruvate mutase family protein [Thermodesulfobacteriota bacterium]